MTSRHKQLTITVANRTGIIASDLRYKGCSGRQGIESTSARKSLWQSLIVIPTHVKHLLARCRRDTVRMLTVGLYVVVTNEHMGTLRAQSKER